MLALGGAGRRRTAAILGAVITTAVTLTPALGSAQEATPAANTRFTPAGAVALPGRGLSVAWSPHGNSLAVGGRFRDHVTKQRYDTRTIDVAGMRLAKSFNCHYFWTVAHAWDDNPYLGEVIVDGGGDHAVKIWDANGSGGPKCKARGQLLASEGGIKQLSDINGWTTSLAFSPDGRYLAGTSRDRSVRIWQIAPGPDQFKVVKLWYDKAATTYLSVRWSPDGKRLAVGDRAGRVAEWSFDAAADRWDAATIAAFAKMGWSGHPSWFNQNATMLAPKPLWIEGGHKQVWNVRYSPDGKRIAAVGTDGVLIVYESRTGRHVYEVRGPVTGTVRRPKGTPFYGLDWSPDGVLLAVGAADDKIYVYSAANGKLYDTLVGHAELVTDVAFSPNGRTLASTAGGPKISLALLEAVSGPDNYVRFWTRR